MDIMKKELVQKILKKSWRKIDISWPLHNFIASNPLRGFECMSFEQALQKAAVLFERQDVPEELEAINRITIKWLQQFFDNQFLQS